MLLIQLLHMNQHEQTIFGFGIEGWKLWLGLCDNFLPVHALQQTLKHALLSDSLDVPSENAEVTEALTRMLASLQDGFINYNS